MLTSTTTTTESIIEIRWVIIEKFMASIKSMVLTYLISIVISVSAPTPLLSSLPSRTYYDSYTKLKQAFLHWT